jgi:hypothetical protein
MGPATREAARLGGHSSESALRSRTRMRPSAAGASSSTATPRRAATAGEAPAASSAAAAASAARSGSGSPSGLPQAGSGRRSAQTIRVPGASRASSAKSRAAVCAECPEPARSTVFPAHSPASRARSGMARYTAPARPRSPGAGIPPSPRLLGWP